MRTTRLLVTAALLGTIMLPSLALAQTPPPASAPATTSSLPCDPNNTEGYQCPKEFGTNVGPDIFINLINTAANWLFTILLVLAVVFIVMAAYKYLFSSGQAEAVESAHKMLLYAAVAVTVALLSRGFVYVIRNVVSGTNTQTTSQQAGGTGGTGATTGASGPTYSTISAFPAFNVRVQICADGKIPGVIINDGTTQWSNFTNGNGTPKLGGNDQIGTSVAGAAANAGEFANIGTVNTAILGLGALGFGTDYNFAAETCNDGQTPRIIYNRGNSSTEWQYL